MSAAEFADIASQLMKLARELMAKPDALKDQLGQLLQAPAQLADRIEQAVAAQRKVVTDRLDALVAQATALKDAAEQAVADATQRAAGAADAAGQALQSQLARADQIEAAAERAHRQALGMVDAAAATAERAREQADKTLEDARTQVAKLRDEAQRAAQAARDAAAALVAAAQERLTQERDALAAKAQQRIDELAALEQRVRDEVSNRLAQLEQLPDQIDALADDARARLTDAVSFPAGILSLVAKGLCWLKDQFFADEPRLQVVSFTPAPGTHGLGLSWTDGAQRALVAYCADHPTASGSLVVQVTGATEQPVTFGSADSVAVSITGTGDQRFVIGAGTPPPAFGPGGWSITATMGFLDWRSAADLPAQVGLSAPTVSLTVDHTGEWRSTISAEVPEYFVLLRPSQVLAAVQIPIPIAVPDLPVRRRVRVALENGTFSFHEGATAA